MAQELTARVHAALDADGLSWSDVAAALKLADRHALIEAFVELPPDLAKGTAVRTAELLQERAARRAADEAERRQRRAELPELPRVHVLADLLMDDDDDELHRISGLLNLGGRVVLAGPHKAGKTTFIGNLLRCLVDGDDFLGAYAVEPARRVLLIDNELSERMLRGWLRDQAIGRADAVSVLALRGRVSSFDVMDDAGRREWAKLLAADGAPDVIVFDCLRPTLDALGLSEDKEAGLLLDALGELVTDTGAGELVVVHHTGHEGKRSRGDSRILDWPDQLWNLHRDERTGARSFSAYGRLDDGVQHVPRELVLDPATRHLSIGDQHRPTSSEVAGSVLRRRIVAFLGELPDDHPGATTNTVRRDVVGNRDALSDELAAMVREGLVTATMRGQARHHRLVLGRGAEDFADDLDADGDAP